MDSTHSLNTHSVLRSVFPLNTDSPVFYRLTVHRISGEALSKGSTQSQRPSGKRLPTRTQSFRGYHGDGLSVTLKALLRAIWHLIQQKSELTVNGGDDKKNLFVLLQRATWLQIPLINFVLEHIRPAGCKPQGLEVNHWVNDALLLPELWPLPHEIRWHIKSLTHCR